MNKFVQDPGLETARKLFETNQIVPLILHPNGDVSKLGSKIFKKLVEVRKDTNSAVFHLEYYILARLTLEEFETIIVPLVEAKDIKHVHIDRVAGIN
jgi:hypothetical protein